MNPSVWGGSLFAGCATCVDACWAWAWGEVVKRAVLVCVPIGWIFVAGMELLRVHTWEISGRVWWRMVDILGYMYTVGNCVSWLRCCLSCFIRHPS